MKRPVRTPETRRSQASRLGPAPVARRSVSEGVADHIRELVFLGELRDGERVPQREIAEALGVSSVPVREALASLQREGVVTLEPNRGAFINGLDAIGLTLEKKQSIEKFEQSAAAARPWL